LTTADGAEEATGLLSQDAMSTAVASGRRKWTPRGMGKTTKEAKIYRRSAFAA
jgi:hypothetical protein